MSHLNYEINEIATYPHEGTYIVNSTQVNGEVVDEDDILLYDGKQIHALRWNDVTNTIIIELAIISEGELTSIGEVRIEDVTDPRSHPLLTKVIYWFEDHYLTEIWERAQDTIAEEEEEKREMIEDMFNFLALKCNFLEMSDWIMLPDSGATEQQFSDWRIWRQRIRDMQSSGDPATDIESLAIPVPPSTTDRFGRSIREPIENLEEYRKAKREYESIQTLNIQKTEITKEEYLQNGPEELSELTERLFSEGEFLSKYGL